jgi:hypothetical protein
MRRYLSIPAVACAAALSLVACGSSGVADSVARGTTTASFPKAWGVTPEPSAASVASTPTSTPAPASAESTPPAGASSEGRVVIGVPQRTAFAVVVGIDKYRDLPAATSARSDAQRFAEMLGRTMGLPLANVHLAVDDHATRSDIEQHLEWLKSNVPQGGRAYFFFSGHGSPGESDGAAYIVPYDASTTAVRATSIALSDVTATLSGSRAKDVVMVVDACFSGAGGRSVLTKGARPLVRVRETDPSANLALFASASGSQISGPSLDGNSGVFTKYVVEGVSSGQADADGDGQLTLKELADWVTPRVAREAKQTQRDQTPRLAVGKGLGDPQNLPIVWGIK